MLLYIFIFVLLAFFSWFQIIDAGNKSFYARVFSLFILAFLLLGGLRWDTGTDWDQYLNAFYGTKTLYDIFEIHNFEFETGFLLLNWFSHLIADNYTACLMVQAIIIFILLKYALEQQSIYPILSLLIYYSMSLAGIFFVRQTIAMTMLLFATKYIFERDKKKFIIWVLIAMMFHRTSVFYLIAYWCYNWRIGWAKMCVMFVFSIFAGLMLAKIVLTLLGSLDLGIVSLKINAYMKSGEDDNYTIYSTMGTIIRAAFNRCVLFFMYWLFLKNTRKVNPMINCLININIIGACMYFALAPIALSLARVTAYFDIVQILIIPYFFFHRKLGERALIFTIVILYSMLRLYVALTSYTDAYIPYKSVL